MAFSSIASNLVPGDTNNKNDIFVRDREENLISGRVREANQSPVSGVTVTAGSGISDTTDADGGYQQR